MVSSSSWAAGSFGLLKMFWTASIGLCAMMIACGYNSLLAVSEMFLMYGSIIFFLACVCCTIVR